MTPEEMRPDEAAIDALVRKTVRAPARLEPADLDPLVALLGVGGALEVVAMLGGFHFITRIADLVGIESDLPIIQRRLRRLRMIGVRIQAMIFRRMLDLENAPVEVDVDAALAETARLRGEALPAGYAAMREAPNVAGWVHRPTAELPTLEPEMLARVTAGVAAALPASEAEATGFHALPVDPLDALVFVATRYAARTTDEMVDAVRASRGWGDAELTDCFFAIGYRNAIERVDRLLATLPAANTRAKTRGDGLL
ncbi:MAG: hypothetical protein ACREQJ_05125 [Candidatus Binatia bacterium]